MLEIRKNKQLQQLSTKLEKAIRAHLVRRQKYCLTPKQNDEFFGRIEKILKLKDKVANNQLIWQINQEIAKHRKKATSKIVEEIKISKAKKTAPKKIVKKGKKHV